MYFMNFRYIKKYGTSDRDDFDARMNYFKHIRWFLWTFSILNTAVQELEMILLLTWTYRIFIQSILIINRRIDA